MHRLRRNRLWLLAAIFLSAVPVMFGLIRAASTGGDVRYLWLAGAAILGSMAVMRLGPRPAGSAPVSLGRGLGAVVAGTLCAAAIAVLMGAKAGLGVAIVALAFGLCTGTSAVFAAFARRPPAR